MVLGILAVDDVKKRLLQFFSKRASAALADDAAVDFADGRDLGGRAAKEGFVGDVKIVARAELGLQGNAKVGGQGMDARAGNAGKRGCNSIGRASCRERVSTDFESSGVADTFKKNI